MGDDYKTVTVENLKNLSEEQWKEYEKLATKEYNRRLKVNLLAWWDKLKVGGVRVRSVLICIACVEVMVWLAKEILK